MTNTIKALVITTLVTNWVPVKVGNIDREIGVVIEHREAHIDKEVLQMQSRIVSPQQLVRAPQSSIIIITNVPSWPNYEFRLNKPLYQTNWFGLTNASFLVP